MFKTVTTYALGIALTVGISTSAFAQDGDRHAGYYYPEVATSETYTARAQTLPASDREARLDFVTQLTISQAQSPYPPQFAIFAKGSESDKLIITALDDEVFSTLYRARGVMAQMSAYARTTEFFVEHGVEDLFTFYDLLKLLGFSQLTITDGESWSHRVDIE